MSKDRKNIFSAFSDGAGNSSGLEGIETIKMSQSSEKRTKKVDILLTPSEAKAIRALATELSEQWETRVTVSDIGRELMLLTLNLEAGNQRLCDEVRKKIK